MSIHRSTSLPLLLAALSLSSSVSSQTLQQPGSGQLFSSFSGQGSIPFRYTPTNSSVSSVNVAISLEDPNSGANQTFELANGLEATGGNGGEISTVFAPIGGWCGAITLQVYENPGNSSRPTVSRPITVNCGPVQLALPPLKRQEGGGGPSGTLTSPNGNATFSSPDGSIDISYTPVTQGGQTFGIDAALTSEAANYTLVNGLWKANTTTDITGRFALPSGACGPFALSITEHQFYQNGAIAFQAAAPMINITCSSTNTTGGGATNVTAPANATSTLPAGATLGPNVTSTSLFPNATSTAGNLTVPISSNITTTLASATNGTSTAVAVTLVPTANITLPISTQTITQPTTIVSTVTTTLVSGTISVPYTTTVSTVVSPASRNMSTSSSSMSTSSGSSTAVGGGVVGGGSSSSDTSSSESTAGIRTVTITASGSSSSSSMQGIVTTTITPSSTPQGSPTTTQPVTSTVTHTNVVVIEQPNQSRTTSTQRQTVILISQSIAAIVQPSTTAAPSAMTTSAASGFLGVDGMVTVLAVMAGLFAAFVA